MPLPRPYPGPDLNVPITNNDRKTYPKTVTHASLAYRERQKKPNPTYLNLYLKVSLYFRFKYMLARYPGARSNASNVLETGSFWKLSTLRL